MLSQRTNHPTTDGARNSASPSVVEDAWFELRSAVAEEFIGKLPAVIGIRDLQILLGETRAEILRMVASGEITAVPPGNYGEGSLLFRPCDNRRLFMRELLLRLVPETESAAGIQP